MLIAAIGDIHSPRFFDFYVKAAENLREKPDLFFLLGDIIYRGKVEEYSKVYNVLFGKINCPIIACFGNEEDGQETRMLIENQNPDIKFLDDESLVIEINNKNIGIVGSIGSLDRPTFWQRNNIPDIYDIYKKRIEKVEKLLSELNTDMKILLIHYVPTYKILEGEEPRIYPELGSKEYERVIIEQKPDIVITGHSHRGSKKAWIDTIPVFNVAFPLNKEIVLIDTEKDLKPGLEKFIE
jgi:Icc-related predicted phosphoesterase